MVVLNEQVKEVEGLFVEYKKEIEELKELLFEIREKIEDVKEFQCSGNVVELVLKVILVESFILGFIFGGGGFLVFMIVSRKLIDGVFLLNCVIDIFYFVRKKRKLEEESFWKDDVKKVK